MNIFVSYTTRDPHINVHLLETISKVLSSFGDPYIDLLHNSAEDKQNYVELKLSQSDILLLLVSDSVGKSKWVKWEIDEARKRNIPVIEVPTNLSTEKLLELMKSRLFIDCKI